MVKMGQNPIKVLKIDQMKKENTDNTRDDSS